MKTIARVALVVGISACSRSGLDLDLGPVFEPDAAVVIAEPKQITQISAGDGHTCAVRRDGRVLCWGIGEAIGNPEARSSVPVVVDSVENAVAVTAAADHTCALLAEGSVMCWGRNYVGELGTSNLGSWTFAMMAGQLADVIQVSAGSSHTCAVRTQGDLYCWGYNEHGQLGDGTREDRSEPTQVPGIGAVEQVAAGMPHTCALLRDHSVWCWGGNLENAIGTNVEGDQLEPVHIAMADQAQAITAGGSTCVIDASSRVHCWGEISQVSDPEAPGSEPVMQVDNGIGHACAVTVTGRVFCWGANQYGELGGGIAKNALLPTTHVQLPRPAIQVAAGLFHSCAVLDDGTAWCWGSNGHGELGDGTGVSSAVPVRARIPEQ